MSAKIYTVKEIKEEFFRDFPEMEGIAHFMNPEDYNNIEEISDSIRPLIKESTEYNLSHMNDGLLKNMTINSDEAKENMHSINMAGAIGAIVRGHPFLLPLMRPDNVDSMAGKKCLIFGGKEGLHANDMVWCTMTAMSGNFFSNFSPSLREELQHEMQKHYTIPKELSDENIIKTFALDHEIAHAITMPDIKKTQNLSQDVAQYMECIADSYAMVKHYQRYGEDSNFGEYWSAVRDVTAVMVPETVHWTTEAIEKVMDMNKQGLIKDLSSREAIDLAIKIADEVNFGLNEGYNVKEAFDTSPLTDSVKSTIFSSLKNKFDNINNKDNENENEFEFGEEVKKKFISNMLTRLKDKNGTISEVGKIAIKTNSSAVYRVSKKFLGSVNKLWPDVDMSNLKNTYNAVSQRQDVPTTEPDLPILAKATRHVLHNRLRKNLSR